jgi:hypothetical protein
LSAGTFAAFSKFSLNTSNSPNTKVVYFVEGHIFHVEWHCWFGVEIGEKFKSTRATTIHWSREILHLGMQIVQKLLRKRLDALCESVRGLVDLQLCCWWFGPLTLKNFEQKAVKQG